MGHRIGDYAIGYQGNDAETGLTTCPVCNGKGVVICKRCGGSGFVNGDACCGGYDDCPACDGEGEVDDE